VKSAVLLPFILLLSLTLLAVSCEKKVGKDAGEKKLKVVTTLFPLYDFSRNIGREKAEISLLLPPGIEPHSFEPKPLDIVTIDRADIFVYTGKYMEPWVQDVLNALMNDNLLVIDASQGITLNKEAEAGHHDEDNEHGEMDPHIWLDLSYAQKMVDTILNGFLVKDPANKDFYLQNAAEYKAKLLALDQEFRDSLSHCRKNVFLHGGHFAFNYLATRYHLTYIAVYKGSPNSEPSPRVLAEIINKVKMYGVSYVYYEELLAPRVAETIAKETGTRLLMLHGAHNITKAELDRGATFLSIMRQNLKNLKIGLQCQ